MNHSLAFYNSSVQSLSSIQQASAPTASNQSHASLQINQSHGPLQINNQSHGQLFVQNQSHTTLQVNNESDALLQGKQYISHPVDCYTNDVSHESSTLANESSEVAEEAEPVIDIIINNVVCTFHTRCHLNLKRIAMEGMNVIYKRQNGMVSMKIRNPPVTASIWSSGKVTTTGSNSEESARESCRKVARCLQRLGYKTRFTSFKIVNVLGTCSFPFGIKVPEFSTANVGRVCYEPELHPGATYRIEPLRATLKIFSTGSVTVTAPSVLNVQSAIEHIYPLVYEYRAVRSRAEPASLHELCSGAEGRGLKRRQDYAGEGSSESSDD